MNNNTSVGSLCNEWWRQTFGSDDGVARMARARLRRCTTAVEVLTIESVHDLNRVLRDLDYCPSSDQLALITVALAHVDGVGEEKLARLFGHQVTKDSPRKLSTLRFQRLVHTNERAQLIGPLRRAMAIVRQSQINVAALSTDLYYWNERVRSEWCFQYFGAANAEPDKYQTGD